MKSRLLIGAVLLCVSLVMAFGTSFAQNQRTGTAAATELLIPIGARDLALGGATYREYSRVSKPFTGILQVSAASAIPQKRCSQQCPTLPISSVSYGAVAAKFGEFGVMGLSIKSLDFGDIPLTTVDDPEGTGGKTVQPDVCDPGSDLRPRPDGCHLGRCHGEADHGDASTASPRAALRSTSACSMTASSASAACSSASR